MQIELGSDARGSLPCLSSSRPRKQNENFLTKILSFENERFSMLRTETTEVLDSKGRLKFKNLAIVSTLR